jgi:nucleotide-binding universal stress UspA family protein
VPHILIGVDGSPAAERALRRGLQEALRFELDAVVLHVWMPTPYSAHVPWAGMPYPAAVQATIEEGRAATAQELEQRVAQIQGEERATGVEVTCETSEGPAAAVLIEASEDAHTLVIGARGHGGFAGLVLGSVTDQCVRHAACPVLVVPSPHGLEGTPPGTHLPDELDSRNQPPRARAPPRRRRCRR